MDVSRWPRPIAPLGITAFSVCSAAGHGQAALSASLREQRSSLVPNDFVLAPGMAPLPGWIGRVRGLEEAALPAGLRDWDSRATRLAWQGLQADGFAAAVQATVQRHGAARVGLVLGTSASTIGVAEQAYRELQDGAFPPAQAGERLNTPHAVAAFVAQALGLGGPAVTVSTACSSSARAFAMAERWLRLGLVDAAVVGGVDALCGSVLYGFHALGLVSPDPCRPFDVQRRGISVGEAAGFALLERSSDAPLGLLGFGEASDAHHMSAPHPRGLGAERAIDDALARASLPADAIDHVQLHGTATPQSDGVEAALVARRYRADVHASATKGLTGHTMGAAGMLGALAALLALRDGDLAGTAGLQQLDPGLGARFAGQLHRQPRRGAPRVAACHAFGFGGNNAVLIFGRRDSAGQRRP